MHTHGGVKARWELRDRPVPSNRSLQIVLSATALPGCTALAQTREHNQLVGPLVGPLGLGHKLHSRLDFDVVIALADGLVARCSIKVQQLPTQQQLSL